MVFELYLFWLIYNCIYWILCLYLYRSLHVQVSVHVDRGDCDQPEQRNGSVNSSTTTSVGIQVGHHHRSLIYAIRNLCVSVVWLFLDLCWASGIASVRRGDLPVQQFGDSTGEKLVVCFCVVCFVNCRRSLKHDQIAFETLLLCSSEVDQRHFSQSPV